MISKVAIVGTGNVAWHLSEVLIKTGVLISCIAARNNKHATELAEFCKTKATDIKSLCDNVDLVVIAVSDDAIEEVAQQIPVGDYIVTHTSGSISISVFSERFKNFGVLYPLQSFSKSKKVDFKNIPILIEGNNHKTTQLLESFAKMLSSRVEIMDSEKRGFIHLSAVIVNNFVNYLALVSYDFLESKSLDGSLLQPLMIETISRLKSHHPRDVQTGPAKRNDNKVIENHLKQLESNPNLQSLYRLISQQIIDEYNGGKL